MCSDLRVPARRSNSARVTIISARVTIMSARVRMIRARGDNDKCKCDDDKCECVICIAVVVVTTVDHSRYDDLWFVMIYDEFHDGRM